MIRITAELIPGEKEDQEMLDFHKRMICIHKAYPILAKGSLEFLWNDHQGLSYGRFSDSGTDHSDP